MSTQEFRLCRNCKHLKDYLGCNTCRHPENICPDYVNGLYVARNSIQFMRELGKCGVEAKLFEAKE